MMKKAAIALCATFLFGNLAYAGEYKGKFDKEEHKAKFEEMKKERREFDKKLDELIEKFNKAEDLEKDSVKTEIKALLSERTDKELPKKKEMLEEQKGRIDKLEKEIASIEADKEKYIEEKAEKILIPEGQAKRKEFKEKMKEHKKNKYGKKKEKKSKENK
jgi:citrate synthase